jgi:protein kinase C substrate 80K-H
VTTIVALYGTLKSHQEALSTLIERQSKMKREMEKLTNLLDDLARGYNPNYQDMAVKGAVMAYRSWRKGEEEGQEGEEEKTGSIDDEEAIKIQQLFDEGSWTPQKVREMTDTDPLTLLDDENFKGSVTQESGILFRIHEYLPDVVVPYFEAGVDTLLDLLLKANIISDVKRNLRKGVEEGETENVTAARTAHRSAQSSLRDIESSLESKKNEMNADPERWGRRGEFKALDGTCVEKNMGEYTYEFCFFGRATQKPNRGHGNVSLGGFSRFAPKNASVDYTQDEYYLRAIYDSGQRCWNGPDRSLIVSLSQFTRE